MLTATAAPESTVVLEEDFSLFTAGTEDQPDSKNIAPGTNYVYEVDPAYTHVPHWLGYSVYQAGGCAAIGMYEYYGYMYGGYISTPEATEAKKVLKNGQLSIIRQGERFNVLGQSVN